LGFSALFSRNETLKFHWFGWVFDWGDNRGVTHDISDPGTACRPLPITG
jgi:hypothetical protein